MAFPVGATLRQLTFTGPTDAEDGTVLLVRASIACNDLLLHPATGVVLLPTPQFFTSPFSVPVTDQAGTWQDKNGKALVSPTHSYRIELEYLNTVTGRYEPYKSLSKLLLPAGAALDLDTVVNASIDAYTVT